MKKIILIISCFTCVIQAFAQVAAIQETKAIQVAKAAAPVITGTVCGNGHTKVGENRFGGDFLEEMNVMISSNDGGYLLGGSTRSQVSGEQTGTPRGGYDYWIVKIDANGNKLWDKRFGGGSDDAVTSLLATSDGGYMVMGDTYSGVSVDKTAPKKGTHDIWLIKIDADGNKLWDKTFGGNLQNYAADILPADNGNFLVTGYSNSEISGDKTVSPIGGSVNGDFWIIKIDASGNRIWDKVYGGWDGDYIQSAISTDDGGYLLAGTSASGTAGGLKTDPSQGYDDYWAVKIDANGNKIWDRAFGGNILDLLKKVIKTNDGGYLLGGVSHSGISGDKTEDTRGDFDYWLVKIDANGNKVWDKRFGGDKPEILKTLIATPDGGYLIAGGSSSGISGDRTEDSMGYMDAWLLKLDANGKRVWDKRFGGNYNDYIASINPMANGDYLLGGLSGSDTNGDITVPSRGYDDFWIMKMNTCQPTTIFCAGQTYVLTATNCAGTITWSTGATTNSIQVNNGGTYTATCTINNETSSVSNSIIVTPNTVNLNGNATNGTNQAVNHITSTQIIPTGINTTYQAGKSISLQGTFQAQTGSVFKAEIKGCE
ncbi:3-coathanger stack domain-containing protein [Emticicia sp. C21]|uniref:3-coathanger stack domain-containing protein n=1 Tax=Emticicia sp. C21 TaxID=2302915 RepID=UPI000E3575CD|nr:3-coathanger stack domain-containing protein [Emticicia sp. C21]RFS17062.1 hypothetical protein D0T08_10325 [Emticicia sp. C21]